QKMLSSHPVENFTAPDPITNRSPVLLGQLSSGDTHTILYYVNKNDPLGPAPANPGDDPHYIMWQTGINNWLIANGRIPDTYSP
ncbi:MAG: hypothetical protein NT026_00115, partial [Candidatus Staskawiczbacteria bacterium]|nr:hypothetical protein [Candidatus Staskawiczbacteria bacterium]